MTLILKRDEGLEQSLRYRDKIWTYSIDKVNSNMIKMYQAQGEFELEYYWVEAK